ncbi:MAG: hypothetical protein HFE30_08120 [Clostridiales bacterium]|nr:hypothetical protein [Clostridiales bacterium]
MEWFNIWWNSLSTLGQIFATCAIPATVLLFLQTILLIFGLGGHGADHGEADHDTAHDLFSHDAGHMDADASHDFGSPHLPSGGGAYDIHDMPHDVLHDMPHSDSLHDTVRAEHVHDTEAENSSHDGAHHISGVRIFTLRGIIAMFSVGGWIGVAMCDLGLKGGMCVAGALTGGACALLIAAYIIKLSLSLQESGNLNTKNAVAHTATVYIPIPPSRSGTGKVTMKLQERFVELDAMTDHTERLATGETVQVVSVNDKNEVIVRPIVIK